MKPYVGITGAVTVDEVTSILDRFFTNGFSLQSSHLPMIGILASYKTQQGQPINNRRYPQRGELPQLFASVKGRAFGTIHYNTQELKSLASQIGFLFDQVYWNGSCQGLQLNVIWPPEDQVRLIKSIYRDMKIIFQANQHVMNGMTPEDCACRIGNYGTTIDYLLIDPSGGRGLALDVEKAVDIYQAIQEKNPHLNIGFAGGFSPATMHRVATLAQMIGHTTFSIDAEGGLRDKVTEAYGDDLLNMEKVRAYIESAHQCFIKNQKNSEKK
jgi:hypothetical protein